LLGAVLLLALAFRLAFFPFRWVGPDEGSYLMDARLALDGKVPIVDFAARQPLFVWLLAALFKLTGPSLFAARWLLVFCNIATGVLIYALGRRMFAPVVAVTAAALFLLLPFQVVWSLSVITETPTVLLACASGWLTLLALEKRRSLWYALGAGVTAGAAYYTRESAVWVMAVVVIYCLAAGRRPLRRRLTLVAGMCLGYLAVCVAVWSYYAHYLTLRQLVMSRLNPFDILLSHFVRGRYSMTPTTSAALGAVQRVDDIERYAHEVFAFGLFGFVAAGVATVLKRRRGSFRPDGSGLLFIWIGVVGLMYLVRFVAVEQVLFARYLLEVLPPLSLLCAFGLGELLPNNWRQGANILLLVVLFTVGVYVLQHAAWQHFPGAGAYFVLAAIVAVALSLKREQGWWPLCVLSTAMAAAALGVASLLLRADLPFGTRPLAHMAAAIALWVGGLFLIGHHWWPKGMRYLRRLMALTIMLFAFLYSIGKQGQKVGPSYDGLWSLGTVKQVAQVLSAHGKPGDVVLSGGQIWPFAAGLECFLDITHTLGLQYVPDSTMQRVFAEQPPEFIIMDGCTERRTNPHAQLLAGKMESLYESVATVKGSLYPVVVYRLQAERGGEPAHLQRRGIAEVAR